MLIRRFIHNRRALITHITLITLIALAGLATIALPQAAAQEGGDIQYNDPVIVTLNPGESVTRTFSVQPGDTVDIILSRLTQYTFSAVLIDPNQAANPLTPGADGNITTRIDNAPTGGLYTLVIQASEGSGDLLIQVNSTNVPPAALPVGESALTVTTSAQRFELVPPEGMATMVLSLGPVSDPAADPGAPPGTVPGFSLIDAATGNVVLVVSEGSLPALSITLPAQQTFLLELDPSDTPQQLGVNWSEGEGSETSSTSSEPSVGDGSSEQTQLTATPAPTDTPPSTSTCQMIFAGQVNIRSGPGLQYDPPIGQAQAGDVLPVTAHNGNFNWYQVVFNGDFGWAAGTIANTTLQGECTNLPVVQVPPPGTASATPTNTSTPTIGPSPTHTLTATVGPSPTSTNTPTRTPTATVGPSPTRTNTPTASATTSNPTATFTPSSTPSATATVAQPTATYTPSYTPTTPPAAQVAPEDARFNNPLNVPLDNTASVLDFVSYPGGDREDRVRWDITGMNPNAALSGGRARLVIAVSCFGTGIEHIQFFTGGQTFSCGQTIVDREVTADSRTGSVVITAVGGEGTYVQWVLTGTATRVN